MYTVNLCVIATGKYVSFLPTFLESARRYFCCDLKPRFHIWTDAPLACRSWIVRHHLAPGAWNKITLHRYHAMLAAASELLAADYTYYIDVDMLFVRPVNDEIFSDVVAVIHPGYEHTHVSKLPYETRIESAACVHPRWRWRYYIGAFQGGWTRRWLTVMMKMRDAIDQDERIGIEARWQDESHWNRYLAVNYPTLALSPDYCCYPDHRSQAREATRKILHIVKNEKELHV